MYHTKKLALTNQFFVLRLLLRVQELPLFATLTHTIRLTVSVLYFVNNYSFEIIVNYFETYRFVLINWNKHLLTVEYCHKIFQFFFFGLLAAFRSGILEILPIIIKHSQRKTSTAQFIPLDVDTMYYFPQVFITLKNHSVMIIVVLFL